MQTPRRPTGHWTLAVHALPEHLASAGFNDGPTVLGLASQGREVLLRVAGEVGRHDWAPPLPSWSRTTEACAAIGDWLCRFHRAQVGFAPDPGLPWRMVCGRPLRLGEVVLHHDAGPDKHDRTHFSRCGSRAA